MLKRAASVGVVCLAVAGCGSSGLSVRERPGQDYALYMHSMYDVPVGQQRRAGKLAFSARLAVVQIGEVSPPTRMLETLKQEVKLFGEVAGLPGVTPEMRQLDVRYNRQSRLFEGGPKPAAAGAQEHLRGMCRLARDMGMTHLLVFGGTIDHDTNETGLSALDLTIIGAFVVPSREIRATARASAALIDVESESVVMIVSADDDRAKWTPAVGQDRDRVKLMQQMRDNLVEELTANFITMCRDRAGGAVAAGGE